MKINMDRALAEQPERKIIQAGIHTRLINSLPYDTGGEPIVLVGMTKEGAKALKDYVIEARGEAYTKWVIFSAVTNISKWGAGYWSDRFYFMADVLENIDTLPEADKAFVKLMVSPAGFAEILQLREEDIKKPSWWQKFKSWMSNGE